MTDQATTAPAPPWVLELTEHQLQAIDAWNARRAELERLAAVRSRSREELLDARRRLEALRRQHRALVQRTDEHLRESVDVLRTSVPVRAVLAHRNAWFRGKVGDCLAEHGVRVVCSLEDGADAVGAGVVEQADLVVVEDALPTVRGEDVVRELRHYSPRSAVVAHVAHEDAVAAMLSAGASAAYPRRVPPGDVALQAVALLGDRRPPRPGVRQAVPSTA